MVPSIPAEVVYSVLDHLWDDPWTLFNCALTCRTWRDASRRLLKRWNGLQIFDFENLDRVSRLVNFRKTRHFYRDLGQLYLTDDKEKPFVHVFPLRLPGTLFPNVRLLRLSQLDWTSRRPHANIFSLTTAFASIIDLSVLNSRFGTFADLHKFIIAFRNVVALELNAIHVSSPTTLGLKYRDLSKVPRSPIKWLRLEALQLDTTVLVYNPRSEQPMLLNPILALCTTFTSITIIHMRRCTFRMWNDVHRFMSSFPCLQDVKMLDVSCDLSNRLFEPSREGDDPTMPKLERFVAHVGTALEGNRVLDWLTAGQSMRNLRTLSVGPCNTYAVGRTLRVIGRGLDNLNLQTVTLGEAVDRHITFNFASGADVLLLRIDVHQDTPELQMSCLAMLQGLREFEPVSRPARRIKLRFNWDSRAQFMKKSQPMASIPDSKVIKAILSRPVFAAVERVIVDLKLYPMMHSAASANLKAAGDRIRHMLPAWDAFGILEFLYPPWCESNPDEGQSVQDISRSGLGDDAEDWDLWKDE